VLKREFFCIVKGLAADVTDKSQAWGLLCNHVIKVISIIFIFPSNGTPVEWNWYGKTEVFGEKHVQVQLCPPRTPHGLNRDRTQASAVEGRRLTAWVMARPYNENYTACGLSVYGNFIKEWNYNLDLKTQRRNFMLHIKQIEPTLSLL
jgi:hypothetical protein